MNVTILRLENLTVGIRAGETAASTILLYLERASRILSSGLEARVLPGLQPPQGRRHNGRRRRGQHQVEVDVDVGQVMTGGG